MAHSNHGGSLTDSESRVLVLYTGGTIGMIAHPSSGYLPEPRLLTETLRAQSRFHDPTGSTLFSNLSSIEAFRSWSTSGRSTPTSKPSPTAATHDDNAGPTLRVRSSTPVKGGEKPEEEDAWVVDLPCLVTPKSYTKGGAGGARSVRYVVLEYEPLLDSSEMGPSDWLRIARDIELNYTHFDSFVVLHGTDTMSYTASALSFLLEDLGKTVIVTGAQIPLSQLRNDAVDNLLGALVLAGSYVIPEVSLYFDHLLLRGNRASKVSTASFDAFQSLDCEPLVKVGINIEVNWPLVLRPETLRPFRAHKSLCPNVATLRLFPGITPASVRAILAAPLQGLVLESFGAGNAPKTPELLAAFAEASERGVVIVNVTQCGRGSVSAAYETGRALLAVGVIPGADMTCEAALAKLSYLLSKPDLTPSAVRSLIARPLRGELTLPAYEPTAPLSSQTKIHTLLSQLVSLSSPSSSTNATMTPSAAPASSDSLTASWDPTPLAAARAQAALTPYLLNLAAARDDTAALGRCLDEAGREAGGLMNGLERASGRNALHVACLYGSEKAADLLLHRGALVHLRDSLNHTPLYYAARSGHAEVVKLLREAGAHLGDPEVEGGFVRLAVEKARRANDLEQLSVWQLTGVDLHAQDGKAGENATQ